MTVPSLCSPRAYGSSVVASLTPSKEPKALQAHPSQPPLQGWVGGYSVSETRFLPGLGVLPNGGAAVPLLESRRDPALPVDSDVKGMSSNVKTALPVRTHPRCATLGWSHWSARKPLVIATPHEADDGSAMPRLPQ